MVQNASTQLTDEQLANPLINLPERPHAMPAWDEIKPEHFKPAMEWAVEIAKANIQEFESVGFEDATFENTIEALEFYDTEINRIWAVLSYFTNNATTDELDEIENVLHGMIVPLGIDVMANVDTFKKVEKIAANTSDLDGDGKRLTELTLRAYKSGPASLSPEKRERAKEIAALLKEKQTAFTQNVQASMKTSGKGALTYRIKKEDIADKLSGVSKDNIKIFTDKDSGDVVISASVASMDVLEECDNRETRKIIFENWMGRGNLDDQDNSQLSTEIHQLKQEEAQLYGYENLVEKTVTPEKRAAANPETVWNMLYRMRDVGFRASWDLLNEAKEFAAKDGIGNINDFDLDDVKNLSDEEIADLHFQPWDRAYYMKKVEVSKGGLTPEQEKSYLALDDTMDGFFRSLKKNYNIELEKTDDFIMPNEDMAVYYSKKAGEVDGIWIIDLFERKGDEKKGEPAKRPGAWMDQLRPAGVYNGKREVPITLLNCNFNVNKADPRISSDDNDTIYHEGGHCNHGHTSQKSKYPSLNNIEIAWDAVELPSQLNEYFATRRRHFNTFARHKDTHKIMPKKMFDMLTEAKPDLQLLRQNEFGMLDFMMYSRTSEIGDVKAFNMEVNRPTQLLPASADAVQINSFSHIMVGGYSAGYYSYMFANLMVAPMEALIEEHGQKAVSSFARNFSSVGNRVDASEAFNNVQKDLGLEPQPLTADIFLQRYGYGEYIDQINSELAAGEVPTSGPGASFDKSFTQLRIAA